MKGKLVMPVMMGLFLLSFLSSIAKAGDNCRNELNTCTTNLNTCNSSLGTCNSSLGTCNSNETTDRANLTTCLDGVANLLPPPSWSQQLACTSSSDCPRFEVLTDGLWGGAAVLDKETGLVWEQSPSTGTSDWEDAQFHCNSSVITGLRFGWRVPTIQELASLMDPSASSAPTLFGGGYPFSNVQSSVYWSATTYADNPTQAWTVDFSMFNVGVYVKSFVSSYAWCVRGGKGVDLQ